jgi:tetratricopeptide (TPR) repeat protein
VTAQRDLAHAQVLFEQGRFDLATDALRRHLAADPNDANAHGLLSLCLRNENRVKEAIAEARAAIAADPELSLGHYALSRALVEQRQYPAALEAAMEVIRLEPNETSGYQALAIVRIEQRNWAGALEATEEGLALNPQNASLLEIRGLAQAQLGDKQGADATFLAALERNPESSNALAGRGFAMLHAGRMNEAVESYRDALRIDPSNEMARAGLVEALKARNPIYAVILGRLLWLSRLSGRALIAFFVGWFVLNRAIQALSRVPETRPLAFVLLGVYLLVVWLSFAASPLFNLLLRLDPLGRHALTDEQRQEANIVGLLVAFGLPVAVLALVTQSLPLAQLAAILLGLVIPLDNAFEARPDSTLRLALQGYVIVVATLGGLAILSALAGPSGPLAPLGREGISETLFVAAMGLIVLATWISWPLARRT